VPLLSTSRAFWTRLSFSCITLLPSCNISHHHITIILPLLLRPQLFLCLPVLQPFNFSASLLLGKWPSEALSTSGQADSFGSRAATVTPRSLRNASLTETLMLLGLCEFCRAGAAHLSSADHRCRRRGRSYFGAEGFEGAKSAACRERLGPGLEAARA
jgi:hypothetical protein